MGISGFGKEWRSQSAAAGTNPESEDNKEEDEGGAPEEKFTLPGDDGFQEDYAWKSRSGDESDDEVSPPDSISGAHSVVVGKKKHHLPESEESCDESDEDAYARGRPTKKPRNPSGLIFIGLVWGRRCV